MQGIGPRACLSIPSCVFIHPVHRSLPTSCIWTCRSFGFGESSSIHSSHLAAARVGGQVSFKAYVGPHCMHIRATENLAQRLTTGRTLPQDPAMILDAVYYHGAYWSLNNRHALALFRFAEDAERKQKATSGCLLRCWPLVRGLKLRGQQDVVEKFRSACSTTTHGRDFAAEERAPSRPQRSGGQGVRAHLSGGWLRCKNCQQHCVSLRDVFFVEDVHQPANSSIGERRNRVKSLFCVAHKDNLANCDFTQHPEREQMPFKLSRIECAQCSLQVQQVLIQLYICTLCISLREIPEATRNPLP